MSPHGPRVRFFKPIERRAVWPSSDPPFCDPDCEGACMFRPEPFSRSGGAGRAPACGESLASLLLSNLQDHFYCWRGASGARYIFSVFADEDEAMIAGFAGAVVLGVAREGSSMRPVCLMASADFDTPDGLAARREARAAGCNEWHVHFDAGEDDVQDILAHFPCAAGGLAAGPGETATVDSFTPPPR